MNLYKISFCLIVFISFLACNSDPKKDPLEKEIKPIIKKKEVPKKVIIKKEWDSLRPKNVVSFFTEYGKQNKETVVLLQTKYGNIKMKLYADTPIHRANFIFLSKIGYFNTTMFYRVAPDFVIQGGNSDNISMMRIRRKYRNYRLPPNFKKHRTHKYGALASARDWDNNPNKLSSPFEFYIIQKKDGAHHLDNEHTVFGEVMSGFSTMDKIANLRAGSDEWPKEDVYIKIDVLH
jgi:cyclophilin family peptidyl-prolyl cis-trans isomerase